MKIEEFDYHLPPALIAQYPSPEREKSRLMVLRRTGGRIGHRIFEDILQFFSPGDLLVMNNTRVLPARVLGRKETGGKCELLVIPSNRNEEDEFEVLIKGSGKIKPGAQIQFDSGFQGELREIKNGRGTLLVSPPCGTIEFLRKIGHIPLPPYIKRQDETFDRDRYQTVFARWDGSVAAPTAGLHFTDPLLRSIRDRGAQTAWITLHVGIGTFLPVKAASVEDHRMEPEWIEIPEETAQAIEKTKQKGGRVIAVGTTTTRALESFATPEGRVKYGSGSSSLFIHPPYRFRILDGLITNFHLPKSTLVMLACAFAGRDLLMKAYEEAVQNQYRFYSYGDAMLIL